VSPVSRRRRILPRLAASCGLTLALLEAALQLIALVADPGRDGRTADGAPLRPDDRVVLCVGDSFTFGMGASSPSRAYPARLETRLQQGQRCWANT
jgi:hypothetical protein